MIVTTRNISDAPDPQEGNRNPGPTDGRKGFGNPVTLIARLGDDRVRVLAALVALAAALLLGDSALAGTGKY